MASSLDDQSFLIIFPYRATTYKLASRTPQNPRPKLDSMVR